MADKGIAFRLHGDSDAGVDAYFVFVAVDFFESKTGWDFPRFYGFQKPFQDGDRFFLVVLGELF